MSLSHVTRYKVSFVESLKDTDIVINSLATGDEHVHFDPRIDDKSSSIRGIRRDRRNLRIWRKRQRDRRALLTVRP
jgi:hypothetical protein